MDFALSMSLFLGYFAYIRHRCFVTLVLLVFVRIKQ